MGNTFATSCHPTKEQQDATVVDPEQQQHPPEAPEQDPRSASAAVATSADTKLVQQDSNATHTTTTTSTSATDSESLVFFDAFESVQDIIKADQAQHPAVASIIASAKAAASIKTAPLPVDILDSEEDQAHWTKKFKAALEQLYQDFVPQGATRAECLRFLKGKKGNATKGSAQLTAYLEWRTLHKLDNDDIMTAVDPVTEEEEDSRSQQERLTAKDERIWKSCCQKAIQYCREQEAKQEAEGRSHRSFDSRRSRRSIRSSHPSGNVELPCFAKFHYTAEGDVVQAKDGTFLIHALPARIDLDLASPETYALALAFFWDAKSNRYDALQQYTVALDLRGGRGWSNPKPQELFPFLKATVALMDQNFPERLRTAVVYPLPSAALFLWKVARMFLDSNTRQKMVVVAGGSRSRDPPPNLALSRVLDEDVLERMEQERLAVFVER